MAFIGAAVAPVSARAVRASVCTSRSVFVGARVAAKVAAPVAVVPTMKFEISENTPFEINPVIIVLAILGWVVPSSLPAPIALTSGTGLTQAFLASMNANLAAWPKGPAGDDPFWTLCFLWHTGLFAALIFGTIGVNGRKSGRFDDI